MAQNYKGDDLESKFEGSASPTLDDISIQLDDMYTDAYNCQAFGDIIYADDRSPLSNAIEQAIFRASFNEVFQNFIVAGSFESYLAVFEKIFGEDADVTFTVPASGKLQIDIVADEVELSPFLARLIEDNQYVYQAVQDHLGADIEFQAIKGFQSQYELEQMLYEMVPDGIYTEISLTLG